LPQKLRENHQKTASSYAAGHTTSSTLEAVLTIWLGNLALTRIACIHSAFGWELGEGKNCLCSSQAFTTHVQYAFLITREAEQHLPQRVVMQFK
jgi:hypothetical protein